MYRNENQKCHTFVIAYKEDLIVIHQNKLFIIAILCFYIYFTVHTLVILQFLLQT